MADPSETSKLRAPVRAESLTIGMGALAAACLGLGGWLYTGLAAATRDLAAEVRGMRADLAGIVTRLTVVEAAQLEQRVRALEGIATSNKLRLDAVEREQERERARPAGR